MKRLLAVAFSVACVMGALGASSAEAGMNHRGENYGDGCFRPGTVSQNLQMTCGANHRWIPRKHAPKPPAETLKLNIAEVCDGRIWAHFDLGPNGDDGKVQMQLIVFYGHVIPIETHPGGENAVWFKDKDGVKGGGWTAHLYDGIQLQLVHGTTVSNPMEIDRNCSSHTPVVTVTTVVAPTDVI